MIFLSQVFVSGFQGLSRFVRKETEGDVSKSDNQLFYIKLFYLVMTQQ